MAEHENTAGDPLEEAFNAPAAEGHPQAEETHAATDQAAAGETPEPNEEAPSEDANCSKAPSLRLPPSLRKLLVSRAWSASARWASLSTRIFTRRCSSSQLAR